MTTSSAPVTTKAPTAYELWVAAFRPYTTAPRDLDQGMFKLHANLCTTLRDGGTPANAKWPAQSAAEYLRDAWYVGDNDPAATASMKERAEVAETVIIPIICPDQIGVIADAKSGNFTKKFPIAFADGKYIVGQDINPGTYDIPTRVADCYWERSDSQGNIIDNNFISISPSVTVTIAETDSGFTSRNCGTWTTS
ncbi:hypothetical protein ACJEDT_12260 [Rhodococcoides fascians]|uniref:hypothetical protein n=1 Tax=Rhodococcoides fascians TaxID=1828 RepID=UPI0012D2A1A7|nr:hypothetical protein [Rhodococcus fascians]